MGRLVRIFPLAAAALLAAGLPLSCGGGGGDGNGGQNVSPPSVQSLETFSDRSARTDSPATDLLVAGIATDAADGGAPLTSTSVTVSGTITAVGDIKVWWNTVDDPATATLAGSVSDPAVGTTYDIPLTGAGEAAGFLFYTISIPSGQNGEFAFTVASVTGATADNIPLPRSTAGAGVGFFVTLSADKTSPAPLENGPVTFTAQGDGNDAGGTYDYQFWIQEPGQDLWTLTQDYGNGNTWTWTPTAAGSYGIAVWATTADNTSEPTETIVDFEITNLPVQTLDSWQSEAARVPLPATDIPMARITTTGGYGGAALTSTSVTVEGTITAVDNVTVWWNTVDNLATATPAGNQPSPTMGTAYDIPLSGAGLGSGYLFYTVSIPSGQDGDYALTVSSVTGATADGIPLPKTTVFAVDNVTLSADKASPADLDTVGTVTFTAAANDNDAGGSYDYQFWIQQVPETTWTLVQDYGNGNTWDWTPAASGSYDIGVWAKNSGSSLDEAFTSVTFDIVEAAPVSFVTLTADQTSPVKLSSDPTITFTAEANGNDAGGEYEYAFWLRNVNDPTWTLVQDFTSVNTWSWQPAEKGNYEIRVQARGAGADTGFEASASVTFRIN